MKKGHPKAAPNTTSYVNQNKLPQLPMRSIRLVTAIVNGPVSREEADRIAPASNSPHYIGVARRALGVSLTCEHVPFTTLDGHKSWYGRYVASVEDQKIIRDYLDALEGSANA